MDSTKQNTETETETETETRVATLKRKWLTKGKVKTCLVCTGIGLAYAALIALSCWASYGIQKAAVANGMKG